ncbi:hypothetical protein ABZZ74_40665 [Streptomyces sp. NPDC006476]|uniref:hypothetical protein n=1 Tax=Streptomyces sp. NPDC006476 TaxID=3157175 RepID=UPI0033BA8603
MRKTIQLHTEPHVLEVGDAELLLEPEVMGASFVDAYAELAEAQKARGVDLENLGDADPSALRKTLRSVRVFLARQMLPESAELFTRLDVIQDGEVLDSFHELDQAEEFAAQHPGARIQDALRLPTRAVAEILEWVVEPYGDWDAWDGVLALQGVDPHAWPLKRLLNAAEAAVGAASPGRERTSPQPG